MSKDFSDYAVYKGVAVTGCMNTSEEAMSQYEEYTGACLEVYGAEGMFGDQYTPRTPSMLNED